jgi:hypothetical protein
MLRPGFAKFVFPLVAFVASLMVTPVDAGFLDFSLVPTAGQTSTIAYPGGNSPLTGTNLTILSITGQQTPLLDGITLPLNNTHLDFTSGAFLTTTPTGWEFSSGGTITITGDLPGTTTPLVTLFSGTFDAPIFVTAIGNDFKVTDAAFVGLLNPTLAALFGIPVQGTGALSILFNSPATVGGPISDTGFNSGNAAIATVPEPPSAVLVAAGLAFFLFRRK